MSFTLPSLDLLARVVIAAVLGGILGLERVWHGRPAGLRTNMLISISSCLFTILSMEGFGDTVAGDPTRVASQIVVGVGFLGAGTMLHDHHNHVRGLTTASTIWLVAAVGMAAGTGMYSLAITVTLMAIACLTLFAPISAWLERHAVQRAHRKGIPVVHEEQMIHYVSFGHGKKQKK